MSLVGLLLTKQFKEVTCGSCSASLDWWVKGLGLGFMYWGGVVELGGFGFSGPRNLNANGRPMTKCEPLAQKATKP